MGNFLVTLPRRDAVGQGEQLFRFGLEAARFAKLGIPSSTVETKWGCAASFPRQNGSGMPIVFDPKTRSWLLAIGTWFHHDGYASGAESKLLRRFAEVGVVRLTNELEGFFVIVIGDGASQAVLVITDLAGSCHGFVRSTTHGIALSGSSLLLASLADFNLDPVGCQEFLQTGVMYEDRTLYREVRKLGPASVFRFFEGELKTTERYWRITDLRPESLNGEEAVSRLWETISCAARKVGSTFAKPVCDLTGGYDSRVIVAAFLGAGVTFSTVVAGSSQDPDVVVSRGLARLAGLPHLHLEFSEHVAFDELGQTLCLTDGEYDLVEYASILRIHRTLSERFNISINGSFGELARGYWWELLFPHTGARRKLDAWKIARRRYAAEVGDTSLLPAETRLDLASHLAGVIERTNAGLSQIPNTLQMDHVYLMMRMQRWQGRIASSMNRIWPCLSPFAFRPVLEIMLQTRARFRQRSRLIRQMLAAFQPPLADFPLEHGYPAVPVRLENLYRFWPLISHYRRIIISKLARAAGVRPESPASPCNGLPTRLRLWRQAQVEELLNPTKMKIASLLDAAALRDFLTRSQADNFPYNDQWQRLLSLEYALRTLDWVRSKSAAQVLAHSYYSPGSLRAIKPIRSQPR